MTFSVLDSGNREYPLLNSLIVYTRASCRGAKYLRQSYRHLKLLPKKRMRTLTQLTCSTKDWYTTIQCDVVVVEFSGQ